MCVRACGRKVSITKTVHYLVLTYLVLYCIINVHFECIQLCYNSLHAASSTETSRSGEQSHALDAPPPAGS